MLHVAVGVIRDGSGNILISRRAPGAHQGGLWEFPGGKLEAGETVRQALCRELHEEVGIQVSDARPLIKIRHDYGDRAVLLDVWDVTAFSGMATACEGQAMRWVAAQQLSEYAFPAANQSIIRAALLPEYYAILEGGSADEVLNNCRRILQSGVGLLQIRLKSLPVCEVSASIASVLKLCRRRQVTVLLNSDLPRHEETADGLHLSSRALLAANVRPDGYRWLAASCHDLGELQHAEQLGADFAVLAPVRKTATHPDAIPLGWARVEAMLEQVNIPVYVMGGLGQADCRTAHRAGAQGIAGIRAFLRTDAD
ncbi:MAG: Nudix family hydrolase [Methylococcales bacterium]|nr:Nudix family hydrolase [Methylococcales bacterium]